MTVSRPPTRSSVRRSRSFPFLVLVVGIAATVVSAAQIAGVVHQREQARFTSLVSTVEERVQARVDQLTAVLFAARSFLVASGPLDPARFELFARGLRVREGETTQILGFAEARGGTDGRRTAAIRFVEPGSLARSVGLDLAEEPRRRDAMDRARDSGEAAATGRVLLAREIAREPTPGFIVFVPVYEGGVVPDTVAARREKLVGFIYSPFRANDILTGVFENREDSRIAVVIDATPDHPDDALYRAELSPEDLAEPPLFTVDRVLTVGGTDWVMHVRSRSGITDAFTRRLGAVVSLIGALFTLGLFVAVTREVREREKAEAKEARLRELAAKNARLLEEVTEASALKDAEIAERVRVELKLREEVRANETLYRIGRALSGEVREEDIVETLLVEAKELFGARTGRFVGPGSAPVREGGRAPIFRSDDVTHDARFAPGGELASLRDDDGVQESCLGATLVGRTGATLGALVFGHESAFAFRARDEELLAAIAAQASLVIENARLLLASREAAKHAEDASRAKDEFLSVVSHELRTPLNAIQGWSQLLSGRGDVADSEVRHGIDVIRRNARSQLRIIEDILDVGRIITGKLRLTLRPIELRRIVIGAVETTLPAAEAKGIRLECSALDSGRVMGDPDRLQQVVWNLLANAVKFTDSGGNIDVRLERRGADLVLLVKDEGRGIAPDHLPYVFDRFRQVDSSSTRKEGGLGLGLSIVRHLVEAHGGAVRGESAGIGLGASFTVVLPETHQVEGTKSQPPPSTAGARAPGSGTMPAVRVDFAGTRILVVEDDPDALDLLALILRERGAVVEAANNVPAALTLAKSFGPDIVVSDVGLPGEDGYAFVAKLRRLGAPFAKTPAIALTAYASKGDAARALAAGFDAHLSKPLSSSALYEALSQWVGKEHVAVP